MVGGRSGLVPTLSTVQTTSSPASGATYAGLAASGQSVIVDSGTSGFGFSDLGSGFSPSGGSGGNDAGTLTIVVDAGPSISVGGSSGSLNSGGGVILINSGSISGGAILGGASEGVVLNSVDIGSGNSINSGNIGGGGPDIGSGGGRVDVPITNGGRVNTPAPSTPTRSNSAPGSSGPTNTSVADIGVSDIRARGAAGNDPAYTEYIAGFFVAAPF